MAMNSSVDHKIIVENASSEESGWTEYLQDFSSNNASFMSSSSLVSDAAWNDSDTMKRLNLNKLKGRSNRRRHTFVYDDDLEDTASSPVHSPKVSRMKKMEVNHRRMDDSASCDFLSRQSSSNNFSKHDREERSSKNNVVDKNIDQYAELRKTGLCLVPMSALPNYIG